MRLNNKKSDPDNKYQLFEIVIGDILGQNADMLVCDDIVDEHLTLINTYGIPGEFILRVNAPTWEGGFNDEIPKLLNCYRDALMTAEENNCRSIAIPLLAIGEKRFPKEIALQTALKAFQDFLESHEIRILLVLSDAELIRLDSRLESKLKIILQDPFADLLESINYSCQDLHPLESFSSPETKQLSSPAKTGAIKKKGKLLDFPPFLKKKSGEQIFESSSTIFTKEEEALNPNFTDQ